MSTYQIMEKIIDAVDRLPPLPAAAARVLEIANQPDAAISDIAEIARYDQGLTANCLRFCNSSYMGLKRKIHSIHHAVVLLGMDQVSRIVLAQSLGLNMRRSSANGRNCQIEDLWRHSFSCALLSQVLARRVGFEQNHMLFTAALLHDVGKLVIDAFVADDFETMVELMQAEDFGRVVIEKTYFGLDHADVGAMIGSRWNLPEAIVSAIRHHHRVAPEPKAAPLDSLTVLTNQLLHATVENEADALGQNIYECIDESLAAAFKLDFTDLEGITGEFKQQLEKVGSFLKLPQAA